MNVALRAVEPGDGAFLYRLYASTREEELALVDWSREEKERFLQMQFAAQTAHYGEHCASADRRVILAEGVPAGRLYVERREDALHIIELALLPEFRGRGIGTRLLQGLLQEAALAKKPARLHVECSNPALALYRRIGFLPVSTNGVYCLMEWRPVS
jgi:ribosomal protein S18 acetylase RimI-like enzyme